MRVYQIKPRRTPLAAIILCTLSLLALPAQADGLLCHARAYLGSIETAGNAYDVTVDGNTAFVADGPSGLQIFDISDQAAPVLLGSYLPNNADVRSITVVGNTVYLANRSSGFEIIDVTDLGSPIPLGAYDTPGFVVRIAVSNDIAYVADASSGLLIFDVTDPASPALLGSYDENASIYDVVIEGKKAFLMSHEGLLIVDVTDPASPTLTGSSIFGSDINPIGLSVIRVVDAKAYVASKYFGLKIFDVSILESPVLLGSYDNWAGGSDLDVVGNTAYMTVDLTFLGELLLIDVSDPTTPELITSYDLPGRAYGLNVKDSKAFVSDITSLHVLDMSTPSTSPRIISSFETTGQALSIRISDATAYVSDRDFGLRVIDITDPFSPEMIGSYPLWLDMGFRNRR